MQTSLLATPPIRLINSIKDIDFPNEVKDMDFCNLMLWQISRASIRVQLKMKSKCIDL